MTAIAIRDLKKTFPSSGKVLDGISFNVKPGEMVALIGASGSGKSTLIRHAAGLIESDQDSGPIDIHGRRVQAGGQIARDIRETRAMVGVIFQQFNLVPRLSVLTNVLAGRLGHMPVWRAGLMLFTEAEKREAMAALEKVGIAEQALKRAANLSGGQQQRAAIARIIMQGAELLLADEPIASLDPASARRVMQTLATLNAENGITVLVSLHQVEYARRFCPRTIAMRKGRIVFDGPSSELTLSFLKEIYGEASEELILPDAGVSSPREIPIPA
jgi:phosphonate transport system ATP-binding protein